jgi:putative ATP-dependent endonuclease of OLD family
LLDAKPFFNVSSEARPTSDTSNTVISEEKCRELFATIQAPYPPNALTVTAIVGEFCFEQRELPDDWSANTQLKWAVESRNDDSVLLMRQFDNANPNGRYFLCVRETQAPLALWSKKPAELQHLRKEHSISDEEITNDNKKGRFRSLEVLRAIYDKIGAELKWSEAPSFLKDNLQLFPTYRYIDWNTSLEDIEDLANDVTRTKIAESKSGLLEVAIAAGFKATKEVNEEFQRLTKELTEDLKSITVIKAQVSFTMAEKTSDLIINKISADGDIRLDSQGEGVKRQILLAFVKWASRRDSATSPNTKRFIWCFDEPEAHLYPSAQRDLYSTINSLAQSEYQILVGTHSTIFVDRLNIRRIKRITLTDGYSTVLKCTSVDDVHAALVVQNSDILFFNKFVAVEGPTEAILLPHLYKTYVGSTLEEHGIKLISLGGSGEYEHNKDILERLLGDFKKAESIVHYVLDADTEKTGPNIHLLGVCDLDDLIPNPQWQRLVSEQCGLTLSDADLNSIRRQLKLDSKDHKFHKLLSDKIAGCQKRTNYLPSKPDCARHLRSYIAKKDDVPIGFRNILSAIAG